MSDIEALKSCPFCGGPPVPIVVRAIGGGTFPDAELEGDNGLFVSAYVFCHECGADGPNVDELAFSRKDCDALERQAIDLWQNRDSRHRTLYDAGQAGRTSMTTSTAEPAQMICHACGADRFKDDCKGDRINCPIRGTALSTSPVTGEHSTGGEG